MNTKHISLAFAAASVLLAGCAKTTLEDTGYNGQPADLELASIRSTDTKAAIDGTTFPTDGRIGLFLYEDEAATKPYGTGYENIEYSYNEAKGKWTASPSIKVGSTPGYLYGYYPYSSAATDVHAISVASSLNGDDVMYATPVKEVTDATASQTEITMNHALARVSIKVVNKGYTGEAKLSQIKFSGAETAQNGALNALDGSITATKSDVTLDVPTADQTITTTGTTYECLLVPSDGVSGKQTINLTLTIDGEEKTANLTGDNGVIIAQGTKSNITITLSNTGISVKTVSVEDWNVVEVGGHKVTIKFADDVPAHDVLTDVYVNGNSVIVNAWSKSGQHLKCTMPNGEFCTSQSKTDKLVYTFTISDISEDTTATIGYAVSTSIAVSPDNAGYVEIEGLQHKSNHFEGETFKHKAIPYEDYYFVNWQDQYGNILCESEEYTFRPSSKVDVTAVFQRYCIIKVFVSPSYAGSVPTLDYRYRKDTEITLTTTPSGNSVFNGWEDKDGNIFSTQNTYTFTIESDTILIADYSVDCGTDALNGVFTVAADNGYGKPKKVRFSKGNLWYGKTSEEAASSTFNFEDNQYGVQISSEGNWVPEHISHFMWSKDASVTYQQKYNDPQVSANDVFFMNSANLSVNGVSAWHTLTSTEWAYLLGNSTERSGKYKTGVMVNKIMGLVIAPDDFIGTISDSYDASEWATAENNDGLVFLPAAGYRDGEFGNTNITNAGLVGSYWSASPYDSHTAHDINIDSSTVRPSGFDKRIWAQSVRLVTDVK